MSNEKIKREFKPLMLQLHDAGCEIIFTEPSDEKLTLTELEKRTPVSRQEIETWEPAHKLSFLSHLREGKDAAKFASLMEQLRTAGVTMVAADEEDHEKSLAQLQSKSPLATKVLDEFKARGNLLCGWERWDRNA